QCHSIKQRNHRQKPVYRITFHLAEKLRDILLRQGQNNVKSNDGNQQGSEKQSVLSSVPSAVSSDQFKEHLHFPLPAAPSRTRSARKNPAGIHPVDFSAVHEKSLHPG